ncbi:hypothetical protein QF20_004500 [Salmonella enterica subsp. enterica]|nr:hypothetical protein [Salmonella enterica subsp. enterica serovar Mikawasima]EDW1241161.1 hypothetical protein [Salmonella enterica subsp. enterica serovar Richmond]EGK6861676.1 hypothetical protein [Salmonella enterica subsp. enterica serovar Glostrup]HCP9900091.1 hypothetical protein [Salmonella enterica]EDW0322895.1 hypothetical protein [Salmonella enterica subsp. enterica serovar Mikawasima]
MNKTREARRGAASDGIHHEKSAFFWLKHHRQTGPQAAPVKGLQEITG